MSADELTIDAVSALIDTLRDLRGDDETAHSFEDRLRTEVLEAIAAGHPDSAELARLVLTTSDIDFCRWFA